jgi:hypothetical protein
LLLLLTIISSRPIRSLGIAITAASLAAADLLLHLIFLPQPIRLLDFYSLDGAKSI